MQSLNEAQRSAVQGGATPATDQDAPLLVIAGAGSGKTKTLAHRVAHLIGRGVDPRRILLLTFTRRAADEMSRRVARILGQPDDPIATAAAGIGIPWSGTFHSIGARLLREYAPLVALEPDFTIHDRQDSADLLKLVRHELGVCPPRTSASP